MVVVGWVGFGAARGRSIGRWKLYPRAMDGLVWGGEVVLSQLVVEGQWLGWRWLGLVLFGADDEAKSCLQEVCGRREAAVAPQHLSIRARCSMSTR